MNKQKFLETLTNETEDKELKLKCLQYFVDNYPVQIDEVINYDKE